MTAPKRTPVIIVHGGAWAIPSSLTDATLQGVSRAARAGHAALLSHGSALDAVEAAIRVLEDDGAFDAGYGSVLNADGRVELDAAVMTSHPRPRAGGVAAVARVRNPVALARRVYDSPHALLVGAGAQAFAKELGVPLCDERELVTEAAQAEWRRFGRYEKVVEKLFGHDTVGAVALDEQGVVAAGTSTGGISYKRPGRVGDSAIVGGGLFVGNGCGGVSTTGHGESILLYGLAREAVRMMGEGVGDAAGKAVEEMRCVTGGRGGLVGVTETGEVVKGFSTERMAWASVETDGVLRCGIDREDL